MLTFLSNNGEAYNGKLGLLLNKSHPNIWWFIELIKSENTHFTLLYHRIVGGIVDEPGFKERKRNPADIQKDLDLTILKNRYLREEFDVYELNKRASFFIHDHSNKKFKSL